MKKILILISAFVAVIYICTNALAFDNALIKSYNNLFKALSKKVTINEEALNKFDELIGDYIKEGYREFGSEALPYSTNIAIVNASLLVGNAIGKGKNQISSSDIEALKKKYDKLYVPLYAHAVPFNKMITKDPQYVLDNNIIPSYAKLVKFSKVRANYLSLIDLSDIPENGKFFMLKATTGFASGIALAKGRQSLEKDDLENAKAVSCDTYPECGRMLAVNMFQFVKEYQMKIKEIYSGK